MVPPAGAVLRYSSQVPGTKKESEEGWEERREGKKGKRIQIGTLTQLLEADELFGCHTIRVKSY